MCGLIRGTTPTGEMWTWAPFVTWSAAFWGQTQRRSCASRVPLPRPVQERGKESPQTARRLTDEAAGHRVPAFTPQSHAPPSTRSSRAQKALLCTPPIGRTSAIERTGAHGTTTAQTRPTPHVIVVAAAHSWPVPGSAIWPFFPTTVTGGVVRGWINRPSSVRHRDRFAHPGWQRCAKCCVGSRERASGARVPSAASATAAAPYDGCGGALVGGYCKKETRPVSMGKLSVHPFPSSPSPPSPALRVAFASPLTSQHLTPPSVPQTPEPLNPIYMREASRTPF